MLDQDSMQAIVDLYSVQATVDLSYKIGLFKKQ